MALRDDFDKLVKAVIDHVGVDYRDFFEGIVVDELISLLEQHNDEFDRCEERERAACAAIARASGKAIFENGVRLESYDASLASERKAIGRELNKLAIAIEARSETQAGPSAAA